MATKQDLKFDEELHRILRRLGKALDDEKPAIVDEAIARLRDMHKEQPTPPLGG